MTYSSNSRITDTEEGITPELSPSYSRLINGTYARKTLPSITPFALSSLSGNDGYKSAIGYGANSIYSTSTTPDILIYLGKSNNEPTFGDYAPATDVNVRLAYQFKKRSASYDTTTKTYTNTVEVTLTNNSENILEVNEILLAYATSSSNISSNAVCVSRDILGENAFTIGANESVGFELTIKYTIAEPLQ